MIEVIADPGATWRIPGEPWEVSWRRMEELVDVAAEAGAQVFKPQFLRAGMYSDGSKGAQLVSQYEIPDEWLPRLAEACEARDLEFMIACYRAEDVATIDPFVDRHKVASFDAGNEALVAAVIATNKPILVSLGLGQSRCIAFRDALFRTTPLHCVSAYPTPREQMNLAVMRGMTGRHGLSDHSIGSMAAVMGVALGAQIIEKHIRHRSTPPENPDYAAAAPPMLFRQYVRRIREAELLMGDGKRRVMANEATHYKYDPTTGRRGSD